MLRRVLIPVAVVALIVPGPAHAGFFDDVNSAMARAAANIQKTEHDIQKGMHRAVHRKGSHPLVLGKIGKTPICLPWC